MNFTILLFVSLFWGLISAKEEENTAEIEHTSQTQSCFPDTCNLLKECAAMREKLVAMENRLKDSESQILELKSKGTTIAFSAATGGAGHIGPFDKDTTIIYRTVKTNIGNAYGPSTGIFAAPIAGIYYFTLHYHAGGTQLVNLALYKNNEVLVTCYDHRSTGDGADNGGNAVFVQLQQGDQVFVCLRANSHVWGNNDITTFSGFLVNKV